MTYRRIKGIAQKRLARTLGVDPGAVARWEQGKSRPPRELPERIEVLLASHPAESLLVTP